MINFSRLHDSGFMKSKPFRYAFYLSILLHILFLISYVNTRLFSPTFFAPQQSPIDAKPPLRFEIVDPSPVEPDRPDPNTHRLSDKNAAAKDNAPPDISEIDEPYNDGISELFDAQAPASEQSQDEERQQVDQAEKKSALQPPRVLIDQDFSKALTGKEADPQPQTPPSSIQHLLKDGFKNAISKSNAQGGFSFSTYDFNWHNYAMRLKKRVRENWFVPDAFRKFGLISGKTLVSFTIWPDGSVTDLQVVSHNGDKSLETSSFQAIRLAAPFEPLPSDFPEEKLDITFGFYYLLPGQEMTPFEFDNPSP
ncbi:MAG: hypothetical protein B6244_09930 [Candidatus Cloacimonetes bacterium 4572_55]|nr:MAG: hypothetical protein B6244_09930 [Candidatus Cloacimonetes bacterium 4572_55]